MEADSAAAHDEIDRRLDAIANDPRYQMLVRRRSRFAWLLTAIMLVIFFSYISLIALDREFLARPIGAGETTLGIPIGLGVIVAGILLTGVYVYRANSDFDPIARDLIEDTKA